ncbi:MAG: FtsQ-type POTRA domain-containing protein [Myxococcales bacterium]
MSSGTGKRPAATRSQARYTRRDSPIERLASERLAGRKSTNPGNAGQTGNLGAGSSAPFPPRGMTPPPVLPATPARAMPPSRPRRVASDAVTEPSSKNQVARDIPGRTGTVARPTGTSARQAGPGVAGDAPETTQPIRVRRSGFAWRRANHRITVESHSPAVWAARVGEHLAALARRLLVVGKIAVALAVLAAAVAGGRLLVRHVVASPRFALREVQVGPTVHVSRDELVALSTVELGDRLLALDTDVIAARLTRQPWITTARVRRQLPATLVIEVTERRAAAVAVIGGLYLLDEQGHPFKHATLEEADGQVVLTGLSRAEYAGLPGASEAAFREALALLAEYQHPDSLASARHGAMGMGGGRPPLSEIHIDPRTGFSLFFYEGGAEIRLGRGQISDKLARLDEILAEFGPRGISALRVVHLDGPAGDRVPIRLAFAEGDEASAPAAPSISAKKSTTSEITGISGKASLESRHSPSNRRRPQN